MVFLSGVIIGFSDTKSEKTCNFPIDFFLLMV
jgi:hypothetical protein